MNETFGHACDRYINVKYCCDQAQEKKILKNLLCYYDKKNGDLVGILIVDPSLLVKEITDLIQQKQ